jgi:hypothetical protein
LSAQRLYFDHDSADSELVRDLVRRGYDCLVSEAAGMQRATDEEQLAFTFSQARILLSANQRDFARLHRDWLGAGRPHAGIILMAQSIDRRNRLRRLAFMFGWIESDHFANRIEYLSSWPEE